MDQTLITQAEQAIATLGKRSYPGDLEVSSNGWDVVRPSKKKMMKSPKVNPTPTARKSKLMMKGQKGV